MTLCRPTPDSPSQEIDGFPVEIWNLKGDSRVLFPCHFVTLNTTPIQVPREASKRAIEGSSFILYHIYLILYFIFFVQKVKRGDNNLGEDVVQGTGFHTIRILSLSFLIRKIVNFKFSTSLSLCFNLVGMLLVNVVFDIW